MTRGTRTPARSSAAVARFGSPMRAATAARCLAGRRRAARRGSCGAALRLERELVRGQHRVPVALLGEEALALAGVLLLAGLVRDERVEERAVVAGASAAGADRGAAPPPGASRTCPPPARRRSPLGRSSAKLATLLTQSTWTAGAEAVVELLALVARRLAGDQRRAEPVARSARAGRRSGRSRAPARPGGAPRTVATSASLAGLRAREHEPLAAVRERVDHPLLGAKRHAHLGALGAGDQAARPRARARRRRSAWVRSARTPAARRRPRARASRSARAGGAPGSARSRGTPGRAGGGPRRRSRAPSRACEQIEVREAAVPARAVGQHLVGGDRDRADLLGAARVLADRLGGDASCAAPAPAATAAPTPHCWSRSTSPSPARRSPPARRSSCRRRTAAPPRRRRWRRTRQPRHAGSRARPDRRQDRPRAHRRRHRGRGPRPASRARLAPA